MHRLCPAVLQDSGKLNKLIEADPMIAKEMLYSLSKEVFRMSKLRTPLLEQVRFCGRKVQISPALRSNGFSEQIKNVPLDGSRPWSRYVCCCYTLSELLF